MNYNPLIPNATASHDVAHILSESFEDTIKRFIFPSNIADNIIKNNVDEDYLVFKRYGEEVKHFSEDANKDHTNLQAYEAKMMTKQGETMILEKTIEEDPLLKDSMLFRTDGLFQSYPFCLKDLNLIDRKDILPTIIEQSLDFMYKRDLHTCKTKHCEKPEKKMEIFARTQPRVEFKSCDIRDPQRKREIIEEPMKIEPKEIVFNNFGINIVYEKKIRLQNCSSRRIPFFYKYPRKSPFSLKILSNAQYLAPGMYVDFIVCYCTKIYHNYSIDIDFSTSGGFKTTLHVTSFRKPPHLRVYIFRSMKHILHTTCPGNVEFWQRRCTALNDTIDCGHCFVGCYSYLSLIIANIGSRGHFFCLTEDEWISGDINNIDHTMQFSKDCFKIFPSYIVVEQDEVAEICVTFTPTGPGLHIEKLYLISDNNTAKPVEILGDGLYFTKNTIQVHLKSRQFENVCKIGMDGGVWEEIPSEHCIYMGNIVKFSLNSITFTVNNKSAMYLNFYWTFRKNENDPATLHLDPTCIQMKNIDQGYLAPYTTYDFDIDIVPDMNETGHYSILLGLFIEKIPEHALEQGEEFIIFNQTKSENIKFIDIQVCEVEIAFELVNDEGLNQEKLSPKKCDCPRQKSCCEEKVEFDLPILDFGIIPIGTTLERKFHICNLTKEDVEWRLVEVIYNVDVRPSMYVAKNCSTNISTGVLTEKMCCLKYIVRAEEPRRWVSMLLLFTGTPIQDMKLNSVCMVTYEVVNWDIRIFSKVSNFPIVCSLKLHYVGKKYRWNFFIKNYTPIIGCFWLFPPTGEDIHKLDLHLEPKFGIIRPGEKIQVEVAAVPKEVGLIDKIYVPCFFSKYCTPIMIRVLCAVDDVNVYFYIPSQAHGYDRIRWPPDISEVECQRVESTGHLWSIGEEEDMYTFVNCEKISVEDNNSELIPEESEDSNVSSCKNKHSMLTNSSSTSYIISLIEFLKEKYHSGFMKQDYAVEIRNVHLRKPQKFSFYIENATPIKAHFNIDTTNFEACTDTQSSWINALSKIYPETAYTFWNKACGKNGIVVIPDIESGTLEYREVIQINIWVYATTWGIYTEEMIVNINNLTPFYFNVFIEVNGAPIEFPLALNTIRDHPTLRFGHIPYMSDTATRKLQFKNTSCIPLNVQWYLFDVSGKSQVTQPFNTVLDITDKDFRTSTEEMNLFLSRKWYGQQDVLFMKVHPRNVELKPEEISDLEIQVDPNYFPVNFEETNLICHLVGYIFVKEQDKNQPNLVFRRSANELKTLHVEILATIAMPLLKLDMLDGNSKVHVYATEIVEDISKQDLIKLRFKNNNLTAVFVTFHVQAPFEIFEIFMRDYKYVNNVNNAAIKAEDIVEIQIKFNPHKNSITQMANWLYNNDKPIREQVSLKDKIIKMSRHLNIHQRGVLEQSIPVFGTIQYPRMGASPSFLKFGHVRIGMTKKLLLHLHNTTHVDLKFKLVLSTHTDQFKVKPTEGVIPKAIGLTGSSVDISVHFTPLLYFFYQEAIVIRTSIHSCWLEVPMNGYGIQNEKFDVDKMLFQP